MPLEPTALDALVEQAIQQGQTAGAVLLVGRGREVLYHKAYGFRQLAPERLPMTTDTLFDVASLTKPMATGLAVNWLFEKGKLSPQDRVADYLPQVDPRLTVEQLLIHRAGFAPDPPLEAGWDEILASQPIHPPGQEFLYSDIGYLILGKLVEKVDGRPLDRLCAEEFYTPLEMVDTGFNPAPRPRVAANEGPLSGRVHDPRAARLGGVAGHAGLFSTTRDTSRLAVMLLEGGAGLLAPETVQAMTANHQGRSYGFDVDTSFSTARGDRFAAGSSYGHTGFTGTSLWIDPASGIYVILFTNRLHPDGKGSVVELRRQVATAVADQLLGPPVKLGVDRLVEQDFAPLRGHRVGLVTNHTGRDSRGRRTVDLLAQAEGVELVCLFSPEHGLQGNRDEKIGHSVDQTTGLPIYSLYGEDRRPRPEWLAQVDTVVFDIQDAGCRFYTYISTMKAVLETAPRVVVLDRPNPLGGQLVDGWLAEEFDFIACAPIPLVHGMTVGELARLFNQSAGTQLEVVAMQGWRRSMSFDQTGVTWIDPSPNLRSTTACYLYPMVGLLEWAHLSVGRGTDSPFQRFGAPWITDQRQLAWRLNQLGLPGLRFVPIRFTPQASVFAGQECGGVEVVLCDRQVLRPALAGLQVARLLAELYPDHFQPEKLSRHIANPAVLASIQASPDPALWQPSLEEFCRRRQQVLLY